jgi:O-antigen/teichoic acid export membrane protein
LSVKKNIAANVVGSGWTALMSIAFVPLYIKYLGIEAYGLIGVFSILLGWLTLLDMGMTPTISREMARFSGKAHTNQSILDLLRSVEVIAIVLAILIYFGVYIFSEWLASAWINSDTIEKSVIINAIIIMGFVAALKFVENIYKSAIIGLQKQIQLNVMVVVFATLRGFGAVGVLVYYSPTIEAFFVWQGLVSILNIIVFGVYLYSALPKSEAKVKFSWHELNKIKKYAAGMMGTTFLAILLTQIDKMLLVKILTLSEYGYYTMAFMVANVLYMVVGPISQAFFPKFAELKAKEDKVALVDMYHKSSQLITVSVGVIVGYLIFFSEAIVLAWTQDVLLSQEVAPLVSVLSLGTFLNILMWMPYQMQLAHGWTSLVIKMNIVAVLFIVPAIFIVVPTYGAIGAAWVWVVLNAGYVFVGVHFMYRKILVDEKWSWYLNDIFKPLFVCFGLIWLFKVFLHHENIYIMLAMIVLSMIVVFAGTIAFTPLVRMQVLNLIKKRLTK